MAEKEITLNQIGVMLEEIRSDVKAVAEGYQVIRSEMQQMKNELVEKIEENQSAIKWVAKELGRKIEEVREELGRKMDGVKDRLEEHINLPAHV